MKYFRVFSHTSAYTEYMTSADAVVPNIAYCLNDNRTYISTETPSVQYRWVNLDPTVDYYCDGTTKYYKQQKQESSDGGQTWTNVVPAEYQRGGIAQEQSTDCGYIPPQYQWVNLDPSVDYYCDQETYTKYYKQQKQVSYDGGSTWENVVPAEYQQGGVAELQSTDCGYIEPQYQWVNLDPTVDYYCNQETHIKYYKQQRQVSYDGGTTWENVVPAEYQQGGVAEMHSTDCGYVPPLVNTLAIEGALTVSAETCQYVAIADNSEDVTLSSTWSITAGSQYATIDPSNGHVTILAGASGSSVTIQAVCEGRTATTNVTLTYVSGATSETETESTTDIGGNTTTITTTVTEYEDGSSVEVSETIITDAEGNLIGTSETNTNTNSDGSYDSSTVNYDASGNPTDATNVTGDTAGNVSTQSVEYDESGNTVVTGYDIDTSGSESGKTFNHDGVNTDYYAFDVTHGFVLDIDFTMDFSKQPSGQDGNHHNVLNAKRADPEPWYGFQIRHSSSSGNSVQLGTQFSTGGNTNTTIPTQLTGTTARYVLNITYNPRATNNKFVLTDMRTGNVVYYSNSTFPDIEELQNLKVTIGYAVNSSGTPFRYSNITVDNFSLKKLKYVENPTITCSENVVTVACETVGADIYYRLNLSGDYSAYTTSITITSDTVVQAYATYSGDTSDIIREDCTYELEKPVISCDGEEVTITCVHVGVTIYYRLNESGSYSAYTTPIEITADTIVEAYSQISGITSDVVKETCIYVEDIDDPVITCDGKHVTITCDTVGADIYYRLNESGSYSAYTAPIKITANTVVEAYAEVGAKTSNTVKETCTYDPTPSYRWYTVDINEEYICDDGDKYYKEYYQISYDGGDTWENVDPEQTRTGALYEADSDDCIDFSAMYFTIRSLEDSNVIHLRRSVTGNTEYYSLDSGTTWSAITSGGGDKTIATINSGDTMLIKCTTSAWATAWDTYNNFYSTKNIEVYGNIMSLLYGDDFATATTVGDNALVGLFFGKSTAKGTNDKIVSSKNLVFPATTVGVSSYNGMFRNCNQMVYGPKLLPATTLYQDTYSSMFEACLKLVEAPVICATTIASTASTTAMGRMFCMNRSGSSSGAMTKGPVLRITNLIASCYKDLFRGNSNLSEVTLYATSAESGALQDWLTNASGSGTIYKDPNLTLPSGTSGIPSGWNVLPIE